jgi:hypothetical protein
MRAWVEDRANGITYLPVEGPTVALVWKVTNRGNPTALFAMRVWAQTLKSPGPRWSSAARDVRLRPYERFHVRGPVHLVKVDSTLARVAEVVYEFFAGERRGVVT